MYSYQDLEIAKEKGELKEFLLSKLNAYQNTDLYKSSLIADRYYASDNPIFESKQFILKITEGGRVDLSLKNKISSNLFERVVTQLVSRLYSESVQLEDEVKKGLGKSFDQVLKSIAKYSLIHGVSYGFWNYDKLLQFKATEYFPFQDDETGEHIAGLRFWKPIEDKPLIVQFFEKQGYLKFRLVDNQLVEISEEPYIEDIVDYGFFARRTPSVTYSKLPIFPMYFNEERASALKPAVKSKINAYDLLQTYDLDTVIKTNILYWILEGFTGETEDLHDMRAKMSEIGIIAPTDNTSATPYNVQISFNDTLKRLDKLESDIFRDAQVMNSREITGGSLTTVAIKAAQHAETVKISEMEWQGLLFIDTLLQFLGAENKSVVFRHTYISNEKELTDRIAAYADDVPLRWRALADNIWTPEQIEEIETYVKAFGLGMDEAALQELERIEAEKAQSENEEDGQAD